MSKLEKEMHNVIEAMKSMEDIYDDCVKKSDKKGYSELYKKCAQIFFNQIEKNLSVSIKDIEYLDGYYICGMGTNSVVHFKINECPGWKFGIWWVEPSDKDNEKILDLAFEIKGRFFARFEESMDRFKPSASTIVDDIVVYPNAENNESCISIWGTENIINFIIRNPELAFCRDYYGWNYNVEYHTRSQAKRKYKEWCEHEQNRKEVTKLYNDKFCNFVKEKIIPLFNGAYISDLGENWSPRFDVFAPYELNKDQIESTGCYSWFENDDKNGKAIMKEFRELEKEMHKAENKYHIYIGTPFHPSIIFYNEKEQKE